MATFQTTNVTGDLTSTTASYIQGQTFQGYYAYWRNNLTYNVDFTVRNIGGGGTFWVSAAYNHSGTSYGAGQEAYLSRYSGSGASMYIMHNFSTGTGGSCSWSSPGLSQIRVTKNSGYYPGLGGACIQVNGPN